MFFIKTGKKIIRGIGIAVVALLFVLCVLMAVISAVFGANGVVDIFGYNMYICESDRFDQVKQGSAVIAEKCAPYELNGGEIIMYLSANAEGEQLPTLGYAGAVTIKDEVYSIEVSDGQAKSVIAESAFIGRAGWSSEILGGIIRFSHTPWGVIVMALLPCLALIVFDLIRSAVAQLPPPEVIPQVKNSSAAAEKPAPKISVNSDGNAAYSSRSGRRAPATADSVLFTYDVPPKKNAGALPKPQPERPKPAVKQTEIKKPTFTPPEKLDEPASTAPAKIPSSVAAKRYIDNVSTDTASAVSGNTAEITPPVKTQKKNDAFFFQSDKPKTGMQKLGAPQLSQKNKTPARAVIDLEDALASAGGEKRSRQDIRSSRRSSEILAAKSRSELIADDDDSLDKSRYEVDDILAGIDRKHKV